MDKLERQNKIMMKVQNEVYWKPNINKIAKELDLPFSTVNDFCNRLKLNKRLIVKIEIISEDEAHMRFLESHIEKKRGVTSEVHSDRKDN